MAEDRDAATAPQDATAPKGTAGASPSAPEGLGARLAGMRRARGAPAGRGGLGGNGPLLAGLGVAVLLASGAYLIADASQQAPDDGLSASEVEAFQSAGGTGGRILFPEDEPAPPAPMPRIVMPAEDETPEPAPIPVAAGPDDALARELAELRRSLRDSEAAREAEARARDEAAQAAVEEARRRCHVERLVVAVVTGWT